MAKSIIKELIIVLLLCLAIILVLGILLYEYVPVSKTIPNEVSYTTPEEVKEEGSTTTKRARKTTKTAKTATKKATVKKKTTKKTTTKKATVKKKE